MQQEKGQRGTWDRPDFEKRIALLQESLRDVKKRDTLKYQTWNNLLVEHADPMFEVLDAIKDVHPFVAVAALPFMGVLKLVMTKQDNDKRVVALMIEMIDAMSALIELRNVKDTTRSAADGRTIESNLRRVLTEVKCNVEEAGNLVDSYSKAPSLHRVLRGQEWKEKFKDMAETFQMGKSKIQTAIEIHIVKSVDNVMSKVDHILSRMLEWFDRPPYVEEQRLLKLVGQKGGQKLLENEAAFLSLYIDNGSGERSRESSSGISGDPKGTEDSRAKTKDAKKAWEEIKGPLSDFLNENRTTFENKMKMQEQRLVGAIKQSEDTIIREINKGPYCNVTHREIQDLWKTMDWRLSVKTRHFIMALHDHYLHGSYAASQENASDDAEVAESTPPTNDTQRAPLVDPADRWCLQYLRFRHLPAISEAIDDDGSGFILISELNEFTECIPDGWNLLKWVAYWAGGWPAEMHRYSRLLQDIMVCLSEAQLNVKPENTEYVNDYMNGFTFSEIKLLVTSIHTRRTTPRRSELYRLATELRSRNEETLRANLETVKYNIDDPDMLPVLCGPGRVEKYLFCLLYLLLKKHLEIVRYASQHALHYREMDTAETSLYNVIEKVYQRVDELRESFRQQKLDVNEHFKTFACGIYSRYHYSDPTKGVGLMPERPNPEVYGYEYEDTWDESEKIEDQSNGDEEVSSPQKSDDPGPQPGDDIGAASHSGDEMLRTPIPAEGNVDDQATDMSASAKKDHTSQAIASTGEEKSQTPDSKPGMPNDELARLHSWHIYFPCDACKSGSLLDRFRCPGVGPLVRPDRSSQIIDPTRFGPFYLDTSAYENPSSLSEDSIPWPSLRAKLSGVGSRKTFEIAIQRELERVRLLPPRMGWPYLLYRRRIRQKWVEIELDEDSQFLGKHQYKERSPPKEEELEMLKAKMMPGDIDYFNSLAHLQERLRIIHWGYYCNGCHSQISGKRFRCLDCSWVYGIDLCDTCENATIPRHDVTEHPPSHTMMQFTYPDTNEFTSATFKNRAQKYMIKHSKKPCPCIEVEPNAPSDSTTVPLICGNCQKKMKNEVHFRCLQCPDYDLCGECEREQPRAHCAAHVLLKLKAPFLERKSDDSSEDEEEQPLSVEARLIRLTQRMREMETKFGNRLIKLQEEFVRVVTLRENSETKEKRRGHPDTPTRASSL